MYVLLASQPIDNIDVCKNRWRRDSDHAWNWVFHIQGEFLTFGQSLRPPFMESIGAIVFVQEMHT